MFPDYFGAPPGSSNCNVQEFTAGDGVAWQTWVKPRGCSMIQMVGASWMMTTLSPSADMVALVTE